MSKFKAIFLHQEPWEAERFRDAVGSDMEVVAYPQGTDVASIDESHHDAQMVVGGGGVRSVETAEKFPGFANRRRGPAILQRPVDFSSVLRL